MEQLSSEAFGENVGKILCCKCGVLIEPNPANMCIPCIRTQVDISEGIPKQVVIYFCKGCDRYLQPPAQWIPCTLESRELLAFCLKKLKGLNQVHLIDATFVWTEPHSRRIKVKLTVQKEVFGGAILQQVFVVEYIVNNNMCSDCHKRESHHFWKAVVQLRQKVQHKKTFFYLEQLILKHQMHQNCLNIKTSSGGLDFFFGKKDDARKMVDFFTSVVPCKYTTSQQLISHDTHSNTFNYKFTFSVDIVPICKHDVVCLPLPLARTLGNIGQVCICHRVTNSIYLIDPCTLQTTDVTCQQYWRNPFHAIGSIRQFTEYTVMDTSYILDSERKIYAGQGPISFKHVLSDALVVRSSELGTTDNFIHTRTHMGHLLKPGDLALGLDLSTINVNNTDFNKLKKENLPDVVLVKKIYEDKVSRHRRRKWKLKHLDIDANTDTSSIQNDYEEFLEDLEEDPGYRQNINIYKDHEKLAIDSDENCYDTPQITLQDMMDDLTIEDATGVEDYEIFAIDSDENCDDTSEISLQDMMDDLIREDAMGVKGDGLCEKISEHRPERPYCGKFRQSSTTLAEACSHGDIKTAKKLLEEGKNVNEVTEEGQSLLSLACSSGFYELAKLLLAMKANVEGRGLKGMTPLMEAANAGHLDIVKLLIQHGADVNAKTSRDPEKLAIDSDENCSVTSDVSLQDMMNDLILVDANGAKGG